ncbi:MAG TPA: radical SAM protein [Bacteroidales bacterium]|jgi:MoaA/NifB/PqqE/SkfB family radical SAM enzyme|nr:radical SAM protein [Bacteroidales bacterium]HQP78337.1 radical SAM protein [Bacteroidales bacterium]
MKRTFKESMQAFAVKQALHYLDEDPEKDFPKIIRWAEKFDKGGKNARLIQPFHNFIKDPDNNWNIMIKSLWTDIDRDVFKVFFENFIVNASLAARHRHVKYREEHGCNIPWAILMDLTSACNLKCMGCWAADYGNKLNLEYEVLDDIIRQGKELGTYMYIYSGGEPLVRKDDIIRLCEAHPDCMFLAFTNGTLIDEKFADEMLRVKNFIPAISIEGFEEATDYRRGKGTYQRVKNAMRILKEKKLAFGASCCYTSKNIDSLSSEEYIDMLIESGAKFAWFFHYMPIGNTAVPELLPSPEQREVMYHKIREYRKTKPIFTIDFQNDGQYVKGCIAGGRSYLHINANGDIEPCAFIHYADSNIRTHTLLEALKRPLFMAYKEGQPFNDNLLRPCPMLENPECLCNMVKKSGAHSTDMQSPENIDDLYAKCKPYADRWAPKADELWAAGHK